MSYILEALKQAEQRHQRGQVPDLHTQALAPPGNQSKAGLFGRPWLVLASAGVGLALVLALLWRVFPPDQSSAKLLLEQGKVSAPSARDNATQQLALPLKVAEPPLRNDEWLFPAQSLDAVKGVRLETGKHSDTAQPVARQQQPKAATQSKPKAVTASAPSVALAPVVALPPTKTQPTKATKPERNLPHLTQLPIDIQRKLPALQMSIHIFSPQPEARLVRIDGRKLREGERLNAKLQLSEITPQGVILSYDKRQFWLGTR